MRRADLLLLRLVVLSVLLVGCTSIPTAQGPPATITLQPSETPTVTRTEPPQITAVTNTEQPIQRIELTGPIADGSAEVSGLAWYGDSLILLPQYPDIFDQTGDGLLFYLPKADILSYIDGQTQGPLEPRPIQLIAPNLSGRIARYQGLESIGFHGDRVFLTIEAGNKKGMMGYLVSGTIQPDLSSLTLDTAKLAEIPPQAALANRADEALLVLDDKVITFYEENGLALNPDPVAHILNFELEPLESLPFPNIEYRITDTVWAENDQFWAINYFFPEDLALVPQSDSLADTFGEGPTHAQSFRVERLVKLQYSESAITLIDSPPVQLMLENEIRNWEGLVLLDDLGFLLATDKFPTTLLAFVPLPK